MNSGYCNHHWSYNKEHKKDTIKLDTSIHKRLHGYMILDKGALFFKTKEIINYPEGYLLDTKEKHIDFLLLIELIPRKSNHSSIELNEDLSYELSLWSVMYNISKRELVKTAIQFALNFPASVWGIKENKFIELKSEGHNESSNIRGSKG